MIKFYVNKLSCFICVAMVSALVLGLPSESMANNTDSYLDQDLFTVTGKVIDVNGDPVIGATVIVQGTTNGDLTIDGSFSISNVSASDSISVLYIGYVPAVLLAEKNMVITIKEALLEADEVVIVGYGTQKKVNLTGSVAQVDGDVLADRPISNLGQGLQGVLPGLNISLGSGIPGQSSTWSIRGNSTLHGNNPPLILVDGFEMDPDLVNPNDVESVTILRDASASAVYGARGAYGVVLITMKEGKKNTKPRLTFSMNVGMHQPVYKPEYANSMDYANYMNDLMINSDQPAIYDQEYLNQIQKYLDNPIPENSVFFHSSNTEKKNYNYSGNTDWIDAMQKNFSTDQKYDVSLSGGSDHTVYKMSIGYFAQKGILKEYSDKYDRWNVDLDVKTNVTKWLEVSGKAMYINEVNKTPGGTPWQNWSGGMVGGDLMPLMPVYHPDGNVSGQGGYTNPIALAALSGEQVRKENTMRTTGAVKISPLEGFNIIANYTFEHMATDYSRSTIKHLEYNGKPGTEGYYPWTNPSSVSNSAQFFNEAAFNAYAEYGKTIKKNTFKIMAGFNQETFDARYYNNSRKGLISDAIPSINLATGDMSVGGGGHSQALQGGFFRATYDYDERYLFEVSGRYDISSRYHEADRSGLFPSASAAWRISNESFMSSLKDRDIFNELKLRASYGATGDQNYFYNGSGQWSSLLFPYLPAMNISSKANGYLINGQFPVSVRPPGLISPSFTWSTILRSNIGIDFAMFGNRLTGTIEAFRSESLDMLAPFMPLPKSLGTSAPYENSADMETTGWELSLLWRGVIKDQVNYHVNFTLSDAQSKITKYTNPTGHLDTWRPGAKFGDIWGYTAEGLFTSDAEIAGHAKQNELYGGVWYPGDVKFKDLNNDGSINQGAKTEADHGDLSIIGNSTARYSFGLTLGANWRGFDISAFIQGVAKRDVSLPGGSGSSSQWSVPLNWVLDNMWTEENPNPNAEVHRQSINNGGNRTTSTKYIYNGAYARLKDVSLGYTFSSRVTKKLGLAKARIYFSGANLFILDHLPPQYDAEQTNSYGYPIQKVYSFGLNITL